MSGPLLAVDAPSLLYRAFFALPSSIENNALLGCANQVLWAIERHEPRAVVMCFGAEAAVYRKELLPAYHAARPEMPDDLARQWADARAFFEAFDWLVLDHDTLEADDLLGSLATVEARAGGRAVLFTGDRDMYQCVNEQVAVLFPGGKDGPQIVDEAGVRERYGIDPSQVPDFIALRGDPSDGIPGAKGIGEKTAREILRIHGSLEEAIANAAKERPKVAMTLRDQGPQLREFKHMATLVHVALDRPADRPTAFAAAGAAAEERGMNRLATRLRGLAPVTRRLGLALGMVLALAAPASAAPPAAVPLGEGWELSFDHSSWDATTVPGVFDAGTEPETFGGQVGWYRLTFDGPDAAEGYDWALRFETVRRIAEVTLNGEPLGTNSEPYLPFELDATALRPGEENVLEVRVDNRKDPDIPREGWWNWGGITRPVSLVPKGRVELLDGAVLTRDLDGGRATMLFDGWVRNRSDETLSAEVAATLESGGGGDASVADLAPGERRRVSFEFAVDKPRLWAPDHPDLYETRIDTTVDGTLEQRDESRTGIRTVRTVDGLLELNGRPVDLRGASIHEDVKGHGSALTDEDFDAIVAELKALHANVTRAHYLLDDRLLDRLDAAGIMVWNQAPIYHRDRLLETAEQRQEALSTLAGTVLGGRGHASVMTHSVANELSTVPDEVEGVRTYVDTARRLARDLDPTLPPSIDTLSYPGYPRAETYARFPLLGINSYFGWYRGKEDHPVGDIAGFAPYLRRMQRLYPEAAKLVTEFGAEATLDGPADQKQTFAFQAAYVDQSLQVIEDAPGISGAIYWTLQEFAVKPLWDGGAELEAIQTDSIHNKGLISYDGERKPAWDVAEREFAATPLYRDAARTPAAGADPVGWILLGGLPVGILAMLGLAGWALRDIWRHTRPPGGEVFNLPARRAA